MVKYYNPVEKPVGILLAFWIDSEASIESDDADETAVMQLWGKIGRAEP